MPDPLSEQVGHHVGVHDGRRLNGPELIIERNRERIKQGSKSFFLASLLFAPADRKAAHQLYDWCRHCDDAIDAAPTPAIASRRITELETSTRRALEIMPEDGESSSPPLDLPFVNLMLFARRYKIPAHYPMELLAGLKSDLGHVKFRTYEELLVYCYRVASCVGLMMVHVIGVSSTEALGPAADTGLAMQMTNIARDVRDDFLLGRIYLPEIWFTELGLVQPSLSEAFQPERFVKVVARLLDEADRRYLRGRKGLVYLPWRAAFAVAAAQEIYRDIGRSVRKQGEAAWEKRVVIGLARKLTLIGKAVILVIATRLKSSLRPWRRVAIDGVYSFSSTTKHSL